MDACVGTDISSDHKMKPGQLEAAGLPGGNALFERLPFV